MKKYLLLLIILSSWAQAQETPEKFKNPIFNEVLLEDNNKNLGFHEVKITPNSIDQPVFYYDCSFIAEDETAILLKCTSRTSPIKDKIFYFYELFSTKYRFNEMCRVWNCIYYAGRAPRDALPLYSKIGDCQDQENYESKDIYPKINCSEEIISHGWKELLPEQYQKQLILKN